MEPWLEISICSAGDAFISSKNCANFVTDESVCQTDWYSRLSLDLANSRCILKVSGWAINAMGRELYNLTGWQWKSDGIRTLQKWSFFFFSWIFISWFFHYAKQSHNKTLIEIYFLTIILHGEFSFGDINIDPNSKMLVTESLCGWNYLDVGDKNCLQDGSPPSL